MKLVGNRVSYLRNPFAKNSFFCLGFAAAALLLAAASLYLSVRAAGQGGANTGALGFSSIVACGFCIRWGIRSFGEKEKNYILAKIGTLAAIVMLIVWLIIILTGIIR